jgi:sugar (pentulose or hexulose) kinase
VGLSLRHGRAAWARATLEGVAFGMRVLLGVLSRGREPVTELRVSGQAAGLRSWNQIKADVLGVPVRRVPGDATAAGVAMLAGIGVGAYSGPEEAVAATCHPREPVLPDPVSAERYDALYQRYRAVLASDLARVPAAGPGP